jgi:hypothetical protein
VTCEARFRVTCEARFRVTTPQHFYGIVLFP